MDNARKLLLVDPSRAEQLYRLITTSKKLTLLDRHIFTTLNCNLPDDEKAKWYLSILKEYRKYENPPEPDTRVEDKKLLEEIMEAKRPLSLNVY